MRWRKALLSLFLAFAVIISTASLGWSIANNDHADMKIYSLHLFFALYVFVISARSVLQVTINSHSDSILHLTALLTVAFSLLGSAAILPDPYPPVAASIDDESVLLGLWYALLGIYIVGCILAYSTPWAHLFTIRLRIFTLRKPLNIFPTPTNKTFAAPQVGICLIISFNDISF